MSEEKEFKNDHMTVMVMEEPGCVVKLDVSVTPEATKAAYAKAIKSINKEVSIPGFRKGRAPNELVVTHYKKYVEDEWKDTVINTAFTEALDLIKKYPYNNRAVKHPQIKQVSREEGSKFTIEFETTPTVPDIAPAEFTIPEVQAKEVTEADINNFIEEMRLRLAKWNDIEGRAIQEGDYVDLDIESLDEPGFMLCENTRFEVSKKMARWMHKLLLGMKQGDQVEGTSEKDPHECGSCGTEGHEHHHHHHDEDFKPTRCRITVKAIKQPELPELDEEFAKRVSSDSIEKLHELAKKKLEHDAVSERDDKLKDSLKVQIEQKYVFDVPKSFLGSSRPEEVQQMRLFLITSEFAKKHQITVTNNEIYQAAMHEVMTQGELAEDLLHGDEKRVETARTILYTNMLIEKALSKLLQLVNENSKA